MKLDLLSVCIYALYDLSSKYQSGRASRLKKTELTCCGLQNRKLFMDALLRPKKSYRTRTMMVICPTLPSRLTTVSVGRRYHRSLSTRENCRPADLDYQSGAERRRV